MTPYDEHALLQTRRHFFGRTATGIGAAALGSLLNPALFAGESKSDSEKQFKGAAGILHKPHHPATAKRVIYLFMAGAPSQLETFDYKPKLKEMFDKDLPESVRKGQRLTTMTSQQKRFPLVHSKYSFKQYGKSGAWVSELLPHTAKVVDDLTFVKTVHTEAINHDPAITYIQTGHQIPGRPSMGSWVSYGLGSDNVDLPSFVVLNSYWRTKKTAQALFSRLWGAGFLPSKYQGVAMRSKGDPVLYLSNPPGVNAKKRRKMLDALSKLNKKNFESVGDPEINARISQYEMAFRMQTSVPELTDISDEPKNILKMYGPEVKKPGSFARNCLLARRMAERNVKFTQVFIRSWDHHTQLPRYMPTQCRDVDQGAAALIQDLKQRDMLKDTLVIFGGEFGRTAYCQGELTNKTYGRDHHPRCFTVWMAGGGMKPGLVYGKTDDFSYNVVENPVHIHDLNATILHCLGVNHEKLTYHYQGRDFRLTDIHGNVVKDILA